MGWDVFIIPVGSLCLLSCAGWLLLTHSYYKDFRERSWPVQVHLLRDNCSSSTP